MFIGGRLQYGRGKPILQEKHKQIKLLLQEVKWWKQRFAKELTRPTIRMIQLAVPSRFELYITSHLFKKTPSEWYFTVNVWDLICGVLGANSRTQENLVLRKKKKWDKQILSHLCAYIWKLLAGGRLNIKTTPRPLVLNFTVLVQKWNLLLCKIAMHQLSPSYSFKKSSPYKQFCIKNLK